MVALQVGVCGAASYRRGVARPGQKKAQGIAALG